MPTIFLVDDDKNFREVIREILELEGYTVILAENGAVAQTLLQQLIPDLILSDSLMPVMTGLELLQAVKADIRFKFIPFVLVAGNSTENFTRGAHMLGADTVLVKPVTTHELLSTIDNLLTQQGTP
jgi:CheY-like chemotaxis protein